MFITLYCYIIGLAVSFYLGWVFADILFFDKAQTIRPLELLLIGVCIIYLLLILGAG